MKKWLAAALVLLIVFAVGAGARAAFEAIDIEWEQYSLGPVVYDLPKGWLWVDDEANGTSLRYHYAEEVGKSRGGHVAVGLMPYVLLVKDFDQSVFVPLEKAFYDISGGFDAGEYCERIQITNRPALVGTYPMELSSGVHDIAFVAVWTGDEIFAMSMVDVDLVYINPERMAWTLAGHIEVRKPDATPEMPDRAGVPE